jgi:hypothetical protein
MANIKELEAALVAAEHEAILQQARAATWLELFQQEQRRNHRLQLELDLWRAGSRVLYPQAINTTPLQPSSCPAWGTGEVWIGG